MNSYERWLQDYNCCPECRNRAISKILFPAILVIFIALMWVFVGKAHAGEISLKASWYSVESLKKEGTWKYSKGVMANGKQFDENQLTCATRLYPLGTTLKIRNIKNNREVRVKVCDRIGKRFATTRIDLSKRAFAEIADLKQGLINVVVEAL